MKGSTIECQLNDSTKSVVANIASKIVELHISFGAIIRPT